MIKYNNNNLAKAFYNNSYINKAYINGSVAYMRCYKLTPHDPCYDVTDDISTYTARTFSDVYDNTSNKWYKLNNLGAYEEYGVYADSTASTESKYDGKLAKVGNYEYEVLNGEWTSIGEVTATTEQEWVDFKTLDYTRSYPVLRRVRINSNNSGSYASIYFSASQDNTSTDSNYRLFVAKNSYSSSYFGTLNGNYIYYSAATEVGDGFYEYDLGANYYLCGSDYDMNYYKTNTGVTDYLYVSETITTYDWPKDYSANEEPPITITANTLEELYDYACPYIGLKANIGDKLYRFQVVDGSYKWVEIDVYTIKANSVSAITAYTIIDNELITTNFDGQNEQKIYLEKGNTGYTISKLFGSGSTLNENSNKSSANLRNVEIDFSGTNIVLGTNFNYGVLYMDYNSQIGDVKVKANTVTVNSYAFSHFSGSTSTQNNLIFDVNSLVLTTSAFFCSYVTNYNIWFLGDYIFSQSTAPTNIYHFRYGTYNNIFFTSTTPPTSDYALVAKQFDTDYSKIYVPDSAIDAYKNCTYLSNLAVYIRGISTWSGDIPTEAQSKL